MNVKVVSLPRTKTVRRFVDLPKLFELLLYDRVFFPTLGTLKQDDPFECSLMLPQRIQGKSLPELKGVALSKLNFVPAEMKTGKREEDFDRYREVIEKSTLEGLQQHILEMELMEFRSRVVCSCWHLGKGESDAMWKIYAGKLGVMLVSTVGDLSDSLKGSYSNLVCSPNPQEYTIAPVRYVNERRLGRLPQHYVANPWLLKRKSFKHEQEVRIVHRLSEMASSGNGGVSINVDAAKLVHEIVLSPLNASWANEPIKSAVFYLLKVRNLKIPIRQSSHMQSPKSTSPVLWSLQMMKLRDLFGAGNKRPPKLRD